MLIITIILLALSLLYWLATLIALLISLVKVKPLPAQTTDDTQKYPLVSIVIPVCNEADTIEAAFETVRKTDYPKLEFIIVDDRSTDGTSALIDKIAAGHDRIKVIHLKELPEGWLGKVNAMKTGAEQAKGDFILFADADIYLSPKAVKKAVTHCLNDQIDFLTLIPKFENVNLLLDSAITFMIRAIFAGNRVWQTNDPRSKHAVGFGPFMLVSREKFEKSMVFESIKMDICDDLAFGLLIKKTGARCMVMTAVDDVSLTYSRSIKNFAKSIEKTGLAYIGRYNVVKAILLPILAIAFEIIPYIGLLFWHQLLIFIPSIILIAIMLCSHLIMNQWTKRPLLTCLSSGMGVTVNTIFIVRSAILAARNKGVYWRGTFYPIEKLKEGQRI